jgi:two-component system, NarL family, sensor histidine kinase YdfH
MAGGCTLAELNPQSYIWLYFFYGLAFFTMGVSSLQQKLRHSSEFPLVRWIHLLGVFGISYGIAEWIAMIRLMGIYGEKEQLLHLMETQIHGLSFTLLLSFGIALLTTNRVRHLNLHVWLPWMIFILWSFFYLGRYYSVMMDYAGHIQTFDLIAWVLLGFPGGLLATAAYFVNGRQLERMKLVTYARMYLLGSLLFLIFTITTSVLMFTFSQVIRQYMEMLRVISAIGISIVTIRLFDSFLWEMQERLNKYAQGQMLVHERKKTIRMVHDQIIQRLFGAGIFIENMMDNDPATYRKDLLQLKKELNETIVEARTFLKSFAETAMGMEDFQENIHNLVDRFQSNTQIDVKFEYHVPPMVLGRLSAAKNSQLYFIIQEALLNVQKHAHAQKVEVNVYSTLEELVIKIVDDGVGIPTPHETNDGFGIQTMKERASEIDATIIFERKNGYTSVIIEVPWEERLYEE